MISAVLRRRRSALLLAAGLLAGSGLQAAAAPADGPARVDIEQRLDAQLPLDLAFVDAHGRSLRLADAFADRRPALLVFGTYRCADLCGLTMHGVLEALDAGGLPRRDWRLLGVGIDPAETPADALARQTVYLAYAEHLRDGRAVDAAPDLRLLVGAPAAVAALARQAGFGYLADSAGGAPPQHAAGFVVITPDGRTSRYFPGVRFDAAELRQALVDAGDGRIGTLAERLLLLCSHLDPTTGRHSGAVLDLLRLVGAALVLALGGWIWRHRRSPRLPSEAMR